MLKFEIKKIFSKVTNKIAVLILFGVLAVICFMAVHSVNYVDENGDSHSGIRAARQLRDVKNDWAGDITETKLIDIIEENKQINTSSEYLSGNIRDADKAYARKQLFWQLRSRLYFCLSLPS